MKNKLLIVDDEPANVRLLERLFSADYEVKTASSGGDALEMLGRFDAALIISDQRMPGMTGIEFLMKAAVLRPQTVRIILTGYTDVSDLVEAINSGVVYRYITKPWINTDLMQSVSRGIAYYEATRTQHLLSEANARLQDRLETTVQCFVGSVREMIAQKNIGLAEHCRRTSHYAALIGERLGLDPSDIEQLIFAALLHEAPGLRIPFDLEIKKSSLTAEQLRITRNSYENGVRLVSGVPDLLGVANIITFQHEHFDGNGLFDGLEGEKIPFLSRVLAVANAFDEINSPRNRALSSISINPTDSLRGRSGNVLDPRIVEVCLSLRLIEPSVSTHAVRSDSQVLSSTSVGA